MTEHANYLANSHGVSKVSVPDELMRLYDDGLMRAGEDEDPVREALAAVLPRHEQMVRALVEQEILAEARRVRDQDGATAADDRAITASYGALLKAAHIARGES